LLKHFSFVDDPLLVLLIQQLLVVNDRLIVLFLDGLGLFGEVVLLDLPLLFLFLQFQSTLGLVLPDLLLKFFL
jgi:hypothetical protein